MSLLSQLGVTKIIKCTLRSLNTFYLIIILIMWTVLKGVSICIKKTTRLIMLHAKKEYIYIHA